MYTQQSSPLTCESLPLYRQHTSPISSLLHCLMDFFFVNMSSMSLMYFIHKNHMSTSYAHFLELSLHYCPWEPCITPFGNTLLLDLTFFFKIVCMSFYRLVWCDPYLWRLQVHTSYPCALDAFVPNLCKVCFHPFVKFRKASRFAYWE